MKRSFQFEDKNKIGYEYQWLLNKKKDDKCNISDIYESLKKLNMQYKELKKENKSLKKSLDELQESDRRYFEFYNNGLVGLLHLDKKGYIKDANKTSALILGYNPESMIGCSFLNIISENCRKIFNETLLKDCYENEDKCLKINLIGKDLNIIYAKVYLNQIFNDKNNLKEFQVVISDITEHQKVENEMRIKYDELNIKMKERTNELLSVNECLKRRIEKNKLSDKKLRASKKREQARSEEFARVLDAVPAAVWISHDNKGLLITGNQLCYDYLDLPQGANLSKSAPPGQRPETFKIFKDGTEMKPEEMPVQLSSRGKEIRNYEFDFVYLDNQVRHMMGNASPLYDENKNPRGSVSAFIDITKNKDAEIKMKELVKELERSNKELEQFAYVTSHDLKEPLRMISSFTQLLERRYKGKLDQDADEFIEYIVNGANRMQRLLDDLLEYSRITTGPKKYEKVNLEDIVDECVNNLKIAINETNAKIDYDPLPVVVANRTQMIQLFQNLLSNAIKFQSKTTPIVGISALKDEDRYVFAVKDNGIGIDPKYQKRIFKVFQRLHARNEYDGTGIGLSLIKKIVQYHNGNIWIKSELGKGSTFYFTLPIISNI
jgi:two-component system, chemotaxis family, sensor kinase Cph1